MKEGLNSAAEKTGASASSGRKSWISDETWEIIRKRKHIKAQNSTRKGRETMSTAESSRNNAIEIKTAITTTTYYNN